MTDKRKTYDHETRPEDYPQFGFDGRAKLSVTLCHPNGRRITKEIVITRDGFPEISWREIEERQILGELIAAEGGARPEIRQHAAEVMKKTAMEEALSKRRASLEEAIRRIVYSMNDEMASLEADGYSEWNMPPRAKGARDA